jgi:hypothetical protein
MVNSRSLRFGRDDTSVLVEELFQDKSAELQIPPLRYAPVGMTKGRVMLSLKIGLWLKGPSASVGMTLLFWSKNFSKIGLLNRRSLHCATLRSG